MNRLSHFPLIAEAAGLYPREDWRQSDERRRENNNEVVGEEGNESLLASHSAPCAVRSRALKGGEVCGRSDRKRL